MVEVGTDVRGLIERPEEDDGLGRDTVLGVETLAAPASAGAKSWFIDEADDIRLVR
jgi:hypothetical protein